MSSDCSGWSSPRPFASRCALLNKSRLLAWKVGRPFARHFDGSYKLLACALRVDSLSVLEGQASGVETLRMTVHLNSIDAQLSAATQFLKGGDALRHPLPV